MSNFQIITGQKAEVRFSSKCFFLTEECDSRLQVNPYIYKTKLVEEFSSEEFVLIDFKFFPETGRKNLLRVYKFEASKQVASVVSESEEEKVEFQSPVEVKPAIDLSGYYIDYETRVVFNTARNMLNNNPEKLVKILATGPSGFGKSTMPILFAQLMGMEYLKVDVPTMTEPTDFIGTAYAENGSTGFRKSQFIEALEKGNVVIVLDELTRAESWVLNTLLGLFDDSQQISYQNMTFKAGSNVVIVATANVGIEYSGTFQLDEAVVNRFSLNYQVGPMPKENESVVLVNRVGIMKSEANKIVKLAGMLREIPFDAIFSTRTSLTVAELVKNGMSIRMAIQNAFINRLSDEDDIKSAMDCVNADLGSLKEEKIENDLFGGEEKEETEEIVEDTPEKEEFGSEVAIKLSVVEGFKIDGAVVNNAINFFRNMGIEILNAQMIAVYGGKKEHTIKVKSEDFETVKTFMQENGLKGIVKHIE